MRNDEGCATVAERHRTTSPAVRAPRTGIGGTKREMVQTHPRGIVGPGMAVKRISSSVGDTVASSDIGVKCTLCEPFDVNSPEFGVYLMLVTDHPTPEVSVTFFRESISRPVITGRYLWVGLLQRTPP